MYLGRFEVERGQRLIYYLSFLISDPSRHHFSCFTAAATGNGGFTGAIFVYTGIYLPWAPNHYISISSMWTFREVPSLDIKIPSSSVQIHCEIGMPSRPLSERPWDSFYVIRAIMMCLLLLEDNYVHVYPLSHGFPDNNCASYSIFTHISRVE